MADGTKAMTPRGYNRVTERELAFVDNYRITGNATQSYLDAGYKVSRDVARSSASRLLKTPKMLRLLAIPTKAKEMTVDRIQEELARAAFGEAQDELTHQQKHRALELLGKSKGAFKTEETQKGLTTIQILQITKQAQEAKGRGEVIDATPVEEAPEAETVEEEPANPSPSPPAASASEPRPALQSSPS